MPLFSDLTDTIGLTNNAEQQRLMEQAYGTYNIAPPNLTPLELERYQLAGELSPDQIQAINLGQTSYGDITIDPALRAAQMGALGQLQDIGTQGLTLQDKLNLANIAQQEATTARGSREAIMQGAQARGVGGGGMELMNQMVNQQSAATRGSQRDMEIAAQNEAAKRSALLSAGQLGGQMESQQYGEAANKAAAQDAINKFNAANQQQVGTTNTQTLNAAKQANLAARQAINEQNVGQSNTEKQWAAQTPLQIYQAQMQAAAGKNQALGQQAQLLASQGQQGMGLMGAGMTAAAIMASDVRAKKNIELAPEEIDNFLNSLTGYKFNYKDPERYGEGKRLGVMTQDMSKTPMGAEAVVKDEKGTQMIDANKALGAILASLGQVNNRINMLESKNAI